MMALSEEQIRFFNENGFLPVENVLDPGTVIDPIIAEYETVLERLAQKLLSEGAISSDHADLPFGERVTRIYEESGEVYNQFFDFSLPQSGIKPDTPFWAGPAVFRALTDPNLLDIAESIVGPEVYSNPVQHVRIKVPESRAPRDENGNVKFGVTPWHQDNGVVTKEADATDMLTVWFPLMDADVSNGCLQVVPKTHQGELLTHCPGYRGAGGLQIPEELFDAPRAVPVPLRKGDVLLLTKMTVHSSLPNLSDRIRWSFDLRYQPIGQPTGRAVFPGFIARSQANPEAELHDPQVWFEMWQHARDTLARGEQPTFNRWDSSHSVCA